MKIIQRNKRMRGGYLSAAMSTILIGALVLVVVWFTIKIKNFIDGR